MSIGFVGLSHLGIVSSIAAASQGFDVIGFDSRQSICDDLSHGRLSIVEPGLPELLQASQAHIRFTTDFTALGSCDVVYFSVDILTDHNNQSDLSQLSQFIEKTLPFLYAYLGQHFLNSCDLQAQG